ncbi:uncharacterized protein LOC110107647 isoform X1 [Dendrobium catenatum]|uniref:uncharacterized protein LOC110107647 isoform X1 n=1 Tax=Dendrobium catenatum TaxID=906689 RepID=UPI0009F371A3|nr:uncharacterized protein LOC110107647 isoform X1 [Dendrobium catenatum]XP_028551756.1 uncharacterized protein LOC110107647 isoform X1 [Dendrobium catenatum]XP_028551757.1 uncharacterized protein LOC110107647 isoform X1 [Dendrobium catenatum]
MGLSKKEVNLRRLLAAAPHQQNQAKLVHYVTTSRELLEQIGAEAAAGGISSISKAKLNEYSEKIEALAARLSVPEPESVEAVQETSFEEIVPVSDHTESSVYPTHILRRRTKFTSSTTNRSATKVDINHELAARDTGAPVKLDAEAHAHIEKHRKLQNDLTDEMVTLAQQLKESSLMMNKSLNETEMILDSTERAVEQSLASTGRANVRAVQVYSESSKTSCFTWLIIFIMLSLFIMVVLLIRIT